MSGIKSIGVVSIHSLWNEGYTITPRLADPTNLTHADIPNGRAYQWFHLEQDLFHFKDGAGGWAPVPLSRHPGRFAPWGVDGFIQWKGLGLFEKPKFEVDQEHAANHAKAHQNVADWQEKYGEFTGHVTIGTQTKVGALDSVDVIEVGHNKTVESMSEVPKDLVPHVLDLLRERDTIAAREAPNIHNATTPIAIAFRKAMVDNPDASMWPLLRSLALPEAANIIRARLKEPTDDQT